MKSILAIAAFLFTIVCGQVSAQINFTPTPLQIACAANQVEAIETTIFTYGPRGKYVELGHEHWFLIPGTVKELREQIMGLQGPGLALTSTRRVYVNTILLDGYGNAVFNSNVSFQPKRWDKKVGYEVPWEAGELYFAYGDVPAFDQIHDDPKPRRLSKALKFDFQFSWVNFEDIRQVDPDHHDFVDAFVAPEWGDNPAIQFVIPEGGHVRLWSRSAYGFKPEFVYVMEEDGDGEFETLRLRYSDEMTLVRRPGDSIVLFFEFDMDLPPSTGGKG